MKKWLGLFIVLIVAIPVVLYFILPSSTTVTHSVAVQVHQNAALRCLTTQHLLQKWWRQPGETVVAVPPHSLRLANGEQTYTLTASAFDVVNLVMQNGPESIQSFITILPLQHDSAFLTWTAELPESGVAGRFQYFFQARAVKKNMASVLRRLQQFVQNEQNIYGRSIKQQQVTDTLLVVTKLRDSNEPAVETYYGLFKKLRNYLAATGAQETNFPMLNLLEAPGANYDVTVAIPVNKVVPDNDAIAFKRMVPGAILVTEVRGGPGAIQEGFRQLNFYMIEHGLRQPGMPFQSLVTNRLAERDTANWITKLYFPVQ